MDTLTAEILREVFDYDEHTGVMTWKKSPANNSKLLGKEAGCPQANQYGKLYIKINVFKKRYLRSRLAFLWMTGHWPKECIDHINGDSLDDRWSNLREATVQQNNWNRKKRKKDLSLPMGVRKTPSNKYSSRISCNKNEIYLGVFNTLQEASNAYQEKRKELFNEYA